MLRSISESASFCLSLSRQSTIVNHAVIVLLMWSLCLAGPRISQATLVSHWALDDGSGLTASDSEGTDPLTLTGGGNTPSWVASPTSKIGPYALDFDGNDYANAPDSVSLSVSSGITLSAWVNRDRTSTREIFVGKGDGASGTTTSMWLEFQANDTVRLLLGQSGVGSHYLTSTSTITDTTSWHHVVGTWDGSVQSLYIDGAAEPTTDSWSGSILDDVSDFGIGKLGSFSSLFLDGMLDDVGLWGNALNAAEVNALYTLANESELIYDLGEAQELFDLHTAATGGISIGEDPWAYNSDLTGLGLTLGEVTKIGDRFFLLLDATTGVATPAVPEPSTFALLGLGALGLVTRRRRRPAARQNTSSDVSFRSVTVESTPGDSSMNRLASLAGCLLVALGSLILVSPEAEAVSIYSNTVLSQSPVAYWRLNETSGGTAFDETSNSNDGTYTVSPTLGDAGPQSPAFPGFESNNFAPSFDGLTDERVNATLIGLGPTYSASMWIRNDRAVNEQAITGYALARSDSASASVSDHIGINGTNVSTGLQGELFMHNGSGALTGGSIVLDNNWHHIAYTRSGTTMTTYLDGVLDNSGTLAQTFVNLDALITIGTRGDNFADWLGQIDEVAIFSGVLTGPQVSAQYNAAFAEIPEPSSFLLLGLGALGLQRHTRRRRARRSGCA